MCLSQVEPSGGETDLLLVSVTGLQAEVFDRNWDMQGSVSIQDLVVCDYITKGIGI